VLCHFSNERYRRLSLMRASAGVHCQLMGAQALLRSFLKIPTSRATNSWLLIRRSRQWQDKMLNSVSAMFSQLPC